MTDLITERSVDFIERHAGKPFFLFVSYNAPHWPFQPPDRRWGRDGRRIAWRGPARTTTAWSSGSTTGSARFWTCSTSGACPKTPWSSSPATTEASASREPHPFSITRPPCGRAEFEFPAWSGGRNASPAGKTSGQAVITMDFSATILAATGSAPPEGRTLDGIDIVPLLSGDKSPQERIFYWRVPFLGECKPQLPYWQCSIQKAVRKGHWKYVRDGVEQSGHVVRPEYRSR